MKITTYNNENNKEKLLEVKKELNYSECITEAFLFYILNNNKDASFILRFRDYKVKILIDDIIDYLYDYEITNIIRTELKLKIREICESDYEFTKQSELISKIEKYKFIVFELLNDFKHTPLKYKVELKNIIREKTVHWCYPNGRWGNIKIVREKDRFNIEHFEYCLGTSKCILDFEKFLVFVIEESKGGIWNPSRMKGLETIKELFDCDEFKEVERFFQKVCLYYYLGIK
jgi:hypothetical protein